MCACSLRVIGVDWSMVNYVDHLRFTVAWFLEQKHYLSLQYGSLMIQQNPVLYTIQVNTEGTYFFQ